MNENEMKTDRDITSLLTTLLHHCTLRRRMYSSVGCVHVTFDKDSLHGTQRNSLISMFTKTHVTVYFMCYMSNLCSVRYFLPPYGAVSSIVRWLPTGFR